MPIKEFFHEKSSVIASLSLEIFEKLYFVFTLEWQFDRL